MRFSKMHGLGNDYIYVDATYRNVSLTPTMIRMMCDRHRGIGSDGVVMILPSDIADFRMQMFNADGTEAEMCGNASRCVGKYVFDKGLTTDTELSLETKAGIKYLTLHLDNYEVTSVTVDMGEPQYDGSLSRLEIDDVFYEYRRVSMGNPHAVFFGQPLSDETVFTLGPVIETHPAFPDRTNVEFVQSIDRSTLRMRVWERGAGETQACGTGACAVAVAAVLGGYCDRRVTVQLLGGDLRIEWNADNNRVFLTGPAEASFDGEISLTQLRKKIGALDKAL